MNERRKLLQGTTPSSEIEAHTNLLPMTFYILPHRDLVLGLDNLFEEKPSPSPSRPALK
ncbi:hypothetical protein Scep_019919 [Stephania cephalantha]|uniref:Uncharacterized protein n=1 Tax=Stephania cephalantha TaxID=152367 RepID=A0AAP0IBU0_9MAGN